MTTQTARASAEAPAWARFEPAPTTVAGGARRTATVLLGLAIVAAFAVTAVLVASHGGVRTASDPSSSVLVGTPPGTVPDVRTLPLAEATAALEAAGFFVVVSFEAQWERPIEARWVVCTQDPAAAGAAPTGQVRVTVVPPGDPCA